MHHQWELELFYSGISNTAKHALHNTMNMYRYAFVDAYSIYWSNQATGTVSEAEGK